MGNTNNDFSEHQKVELSYIYDYFSRIQDRRGQVFVFFGTASLTALGIALQEQKAGFILLSILFILLHMGTEGTARAEMAPFFFRGYMIEREHKGKIGILSTYMDIIEPHLNLRDDFEKILKIKDNSERIKKVNRIFYNPFKVKRATTMMAIATIALEIVFMLILHYFWGWSYF
jgi:hypothetical protein